MFDDLFNRRGLSFDRLNSLVKLDDAGSLIRAADGDPGVQSRYSHHLKELASYFGIELTERFGSTIRLTAEGKRLVRLVREQFARLQQFRLDIDGSAPTYRFGAEESLLQSLVIPTVASLRSSKLNVRFQLQNLQMDEVFARIEDQRLDFGLVQGKVLPKGLSKKVVSRTHHIIVVPERVSPRGRMLTLKQALLECPHACLLSDRGLAKSIEDVAKALGGHFDAELECDSISQCLSAVNTGNYAAILPLWSWVDTGSIQHEICEDSRLSSLDQDLVLIWHPRLQKTFGRSAKLLTESLVSGIAARCRADRDF